MIEDISRRSLLAASTAAMVPTAAYAADKLDLKKPEDLYRALVRIRGSMGPEMFMGYCVGHYYGYSEGHMTPLYGLLAGTFSKFRPTPKGEYEGVSFELAYFTDFNSGELIDSFKNPYTNKMVTVPRFSTRPATFTLTRDARIVFKEAIPNFLNSDRFLPPVMDGDSVWVVEENRNEFTPAAPAKPFMYNELVTLKAMKADLENPALKSVPTTIGYQSEVVWRPWLEMGDTPGHLVGNGIGRKITTMDAFPPHYMDYSRKYFSEVFVDLDAYLNAGWK